MSAELTIAEVVISEKWHAVRKAEPVRFGLPLAEGRVRLASEIGLEFGGIEVPVQARAMGRWPDGSIRWALLDFQADLDLRQPVTGHAFIRGQAPPLKPAQAIRIETRDGFPIVDTGAIAFDAAALELQHGDGSVEQLGIAIKDVKLGGMTVGPESARVVSDGPLVAEVEVALSGHAKGEHVLDIRLLARLFAGKSCAHIEVMLASCRQELCIRRAGVNVISDITSATRMEAHTRMKRARAGDAELVYNYAVDARSDPIYYEDSPDPCWVLANSQKGGVMATVRNADHHFPIRLAAFPAGLEIDLIDGRDDPLHFYPCMAKSYEAMIGLVGADVTGYELTMDSALFQRPVRPFCSPEYYAASRAFGEIFPTSRKYPAFEGLISTSLRERSVGVGAMHFGDEPNLGYTYDDRGHGELVWTNGEYDTPRMLVVQYARTSNRACFEAADASARHMMDIDFIRDSDNPLWAGGVCCHEGDHRIAAYAGPSHEWAEGLIDYYHLTGHERALQTGLSVGDNVCRYIESGHFDRIGTYALRELGWGLTAIAACLRATNEQRYRATGLNVVRLLRRWVDEIGGLKDVDAYVEPGQEDRMLPISVQRDAFISLTLNGLNRFYLASGEAEAKELFLGEVAAQLEWFNSPDGWAEQRETKLPNMEAFGWAYRYTGERAYLDAGLQILRYALNNCTLRYYNIVRHVHDTSHTRPATYRLTEVQAINSQILGLALIPMFAFLQIAEESGELDAVMD